MARLVRIRLLTAIFLAVFTASASACLNDRESSKSEREFKSHYDDPTAMPADPTPSSAPTDRLVAYGGTGLGAALLVGALTVTFLPRRRA
ncbi:MAG TPA: hypothetical protein DDY78_19450 [Planctomycetales bacterium]|nr:hypothetical protein [Planctomycetales bacterium]